MYICQSHSPNSSHLPFPSCSHVHSEQTESLFLFICIIFSIFYIYGLTGLKCLYILFLYISYIYKGAAQVVLVVKNLPANAGYIRVQFSAVAQSCPTLCNPMNHSTPGLPVHHQLPESIRNHVHQVGDAI